MSFKIPCGGFKLDEKLFSLDKNDVLSIPKPITYDYMPEGYPSKSVGTVTLMEEQEVAFADKVGGVFGATSPVILDVKSGDKLTVVWDGVSYNVTVKIPEGSPSGSLAFGNLGLIGGGDTEDYPFAYAMFNSKANWAAADTSPSHTISVKTVKEVITPMAEEFLRVIVNIVGEKSEASGNKYLLLDKTDEEIENALSNGSTVKLNFYDVAELQYISVRKMFWGVFPYATGTNGITKLAVVSVEKIANGWYCKETYIDASTNSEP